MQNLLRLVAVTVLVFGLKTQQASAAGTRTMSICSTCTGWSTCPTEPFDCSKIGCPGMFPGCAVGVPSCSNAFIVCSGDPS
jgi:hypothetical protein